MVFFQKLQDFQNWIFGDPQAKTFETRKTFFEVLFGIFGFFAIKKIINSTIGEDTV